VTTNLRPEEASIICPGSRVAAVLNNDEGATYRQASKKRTRTHIKTRAQVRAILQFPKAQPALATLHVPKCARAPLRAEQTREAESEHEYCALAPRRIFGSEAPEGPFQRHMSQHGWRLTRHGMFIRLLSARACCASSDSLPIGMPFWNNFMFQGLLRIPFRWACMS